MNRIIRYILRFENQSISDEQLMRLALDISRQPLAALQRYSPGAAPDGCRCQGNRILSVLAYLTQLNIAKIDNSLGNSEFIG